MQAAAGNEEGGGADLRYICFRQIKVNALVGGIRVAKTWEDALSYTEEGGGGEAVESVSGEQNRGVKILIDGQLYIQYNGATYNVQGIKLQ